ncbi:hypothetical protein [Methanobrevibacter filiformis]|nr:hypothetical protein [Methanobrevibacter filiformis]
MGLLTPMIGKKSIVSVVVIGFIIGIVGGIYFVSPIYDDLPQIAGSIQQIIDGDNEVVTIELSDENNLNKTLQELKNLEGFKSIKHVDFILATTPFFDERKKIIENSFNSSNNYKSWNVSTAGKISVEPKDAVISRNMISNITEWLMFTGGVETNYSVIHIDAVIKADNLNDTLTYLNSEDILVNSVDGPVQKTINKTKKEMPDRNVIIVALGILGILIGLLGSFIDGFLESLSKLRKYLLKLIRND